MSVKTAASDIEVAYDDFLPCSIEKLVEILLDCILRETVANCQDTDYSA